MPTQAEPQRKRSGKSKKQKSNENQNTLNEEFLRRELSGAQARIVQLDASIIDKDIRISILRARVNFLEERENQANYNKYFNNGNINPSHSSQSSGPFTFKPTQCMQCSCHTNCSNNHRTTNENLIHSNMLHHLQEIRTVLHRISDTLAEKRSLADTTSSQNLTTPPVVDDSPPSPMTSNLNMSASSVELLIPNLNLPQQIDLN